MVALNINNTTNLNNFFSAALASHNTRSLQSAHHLSHRSSLSQTFLLSDIPTPLKELEVLQLQETGCLHNPEAMFLPTLNLAHYSVDNDNPHISIATYYNPKKVNILSTEDLMTGRLSYHRFKCKSDDSTFSTVNIYGPASTSTSSLQELANLFNLVKRKIFHINSGLSPEVLYLGGDFNCNTLDENLTKTKMLREFANECQLVEMTSNLPPTWRGIRGGERLMSFSKLDHIFATKIQDFETLAFPNPDSNHQVIVIRPPKKSKTFDPDPPPNSISSNRCSEKCKNFQRICY